MTSLASPLPQLRGHYTIVKLKKKPEWLPAKLYIGLLKAGLLEDRVLSRQHVENKIVFNDDHGVHLFLQHLGGQTIYPLELDNAAIGTGSTAPADGDTDLETPVATGILLSTREITSTQLVTNWFITDDQLANGTYNEFGLFCGTQLFCRSIISPAHTKGSNEDTLIEYTIEVMNALP